ncbi:MAG: hypothetical protein Ct9H300mP11_11090 [Chloroflexota bacterium]|nr:MAG: hypothetical protein Ct9H300mP11_11090 [Chloroflexota bacterium]
MSLRLSFFLVIPLGQRIRRLHIRTRYQFKINRRDRHFQIAKLFCQGIVYENLYPPFSGIGRGMNGI